MRPTESSARVPAWLAAAAAALLLAAVVTAHLGADLPAWRFDTLVSRFVPPRGPGGLPVMDDAMDWPPQDADPLQPNGRPFFVVFTDLASPGARHLTRDVFQDRWCAQRIRPGFNCRRVIVSGPVPGPTSAHANELSARYAVRTIPTVLFLDPLGNVAERVDGYPGRSRLMRSVVRWEDRYPAPPRFRD